jgi:hypothetical protein
LQVPDMTLLAEICSNFFPGSMKPVVFSVTYVHHAFGRKPNRVHPALKRPSDLEITGSSSLLKHADSMNRTVTIRERLICPRTRAVSNILPLSTLQRPNASAFKSGARCRTSGRRDSVSIHKKRQRPSGEIDSRIQFFCGIPLRRNSIQHPVDGWMFKGR